MSRARLIVMVVWAGVLASGVMAGAGWRNPHLDPRLVPSGCPSCHDAHGEPRSPMLRRSQAATCLGCHGAAGAALRVDPLAGSPPDIDAARRRVSAHPLDERAFSRTDRKAVVCTSCHSPHRGRPEPRPERPRGILFVALDDPSHPENQVCLACHGPGSRRDVGSRVSSANRSYHPLVAPAAGRSSTLNAGLSGAFINCTECHGSSGGGGAKGPHGSDQPDLLARQYSRQSGVGESAAAFALCYWCHDRDAVLGRSTFPHHSRHVVERQIACSSCHDPHGSVAHRALVSFSAAPVSPSARTGRIAFTSSAPGSGSCQLSCHGVDHGPNDYGSVASIPAGGIAPAAPGIVLPSPQPRSGAANPAGRLPRNRDIHPP